MFVGAGYYDLATPFISVEYAVNHMGLDPKLRDHVSIAYYQAGHMMYTQLKSREKARQDLGKFVTSCLPQGRKSLSAEYTCRVGSRPARSSDSGSFSGSIWDYDIRYFHAFAAKNGFV